MEAACNTPPNRQIQNQKKPLPRALRPGGRRLIGLKLDGVWSDPKRLRIDGAGSERCSGLGRHRRDLEPLHRTTLGVQHDKAGALIKPLLGFSHATGVVTVGIVVMLIVVTAGMVSTTWVQFIKGTLLVVLCGILVGMILVRGHHTSRDFHTDASAIIHKNEPLLKWQGIEFQPERGAFDITQPLAQQTDLEIVPSGEWKSKPYRRARNPKNDSVIIARIDESTKSMGLCRTVKMIDGIRCIDGMPQSQNDNNLLPVGEIQKLPDGQIDTGPLNPFSYLSLLQESVIVTWGTDKLVDDDGIPITIYYPKLMKGSDLLVPGGSPTFAGIKSPNLIDKLDFISLMLALFCGTASLPHILIRYYTVKDQRAARLSTIVGIASIGVFYILTLYIGLAAMTSRVLDPSNTNMAAPLLARSFGEWMFAAVSAVAFTTVLGTVSGLILAASGAVAHDLMSHGFGVKLDDMGKVRVAKLSAIVVGIIAIGLGIVFEKFNVTFLVGWAFNIAASANLPSLIMLLFWKKTTKQGIITAILVGMCTSLGWVLVSKEAFKDLYGLPATQALVPFSQPGLVTIPLGFLTLIVVSLLTSPKPDTTVKAD